MRIVIVDDEQVVLRGLQTIIQRSGRGWEVVAQCSSAEEALPVIDELLPDVVISDIRMYELSGIGLAGKIMEKHPDIMVILLTGYAEFDYAQQAIKLTVFEYLLKPTRYSEIVECLERAEEKLKLKKTEQEVKALQHEENRYLVREKFLNDIMKGLLPVSTDIAEQAQECGIVLDTYIIIRFAYPENKNPFGNELKDRFLLDYGIKNVILETLSSLENLILHSEKLGSFTIIGSLPAGFGKSDLENLVNTGLNTLEEIFSVSVNAGISPQADGAEMMFDSYNRAGYACEKGRQSGQGIVFFEDLEYTPPFEAYPESVQEALEYIDSNFQESITLQQAADKVYLNAWYLSDLFKREVGMTFSEYVQNKRIEKAKQLLTGTQMKLYEVAYAVGIKEQAYFSSVFKKATGMSPKKYREQQLG